MLAKLGLKRRQVHEEEVESRSNPVCPDADLPAFGFAHKVKRVFVFDLHDADTVSIRIEHEGRMEQARVRLLGLNAPEVGGHGVSDLEKSAGRVSTSKLAERIRGHHVLLVFRQKSFDCYGRLLGAIHEDDPRYSDGQDIGTDEFPFQDSHNAWLLENGLALPYNGRGKKTQFSEQELQGIVNLGTSP